MGNSTTLRIALLVGMLATGGCGTAQSGAPAAVSTVSQAPASATDVSVSAASTGNPTATRTSSSQPASSPPASPRPSATPSSTSVPPTIDSPGADGQYSGTGSAVVSAATPAGEASVLTFDCPSCSGPVKLITDGYPPLLIDKSGPYTGEVLLNSEADHNVVLRVTADAAWTAGIVAIADHPVAALASSGEGDAVLVLAEPASTVTLTHDSPGEFAVVIYNQDGTSLTVNESGPTSQTVGIQTPAIITVVADGAWTIDAGQGA